MAQIPNYKLKSVILDILNKEVGGHICCLPPIGHLHGKPWRGQGFNADWPDEEKQWGTDKACYTCTFSYRREEVVQEPMIPDLQRGWLDLFQVNKVSSIKRWIYLCFSLCLLHCIAVLFCLHLYVYVCILCAAEPGFWQPHQSPQTSKMPKYSLEERETTFWRCWKRYIVFKKNINICLFPGWMPSF